jgi:hypothetical protein
MLAFGTVSHLKDIGVWNMSKNYKSFRLQEKSSIQKDTKQHR